MSFLLAFAGALFALITAAVLKAVIEPLLHVRATIGRLISVVVKHVQTMATGRTMFCFNGTPEHQTKQLEIWRVMVQEIRAGCGDLMAAINAVPFYDTWAKLGVVPKWERVELAVICLIGRAERGGVTMSDKDKAWLKTEHFVNAEHIHEAVAGLLHARMVKPREIEEGKNNGDEALK